jgi:hypothetical protein
VILGLVATLGLAPLSARAQAPAETAGTPAGSYGAGLNVSTLGIGAEGGYRFDNHFGVRVGANGFAYSFNKTFDSTPYSVDAHLASGGGLVDYYPFETGLRLTAGVKINGNGASATSTPTGNVKIGGSTFTPAQIGTLNAHIGYDTVAPYLGLGYAGRVSPAFELSVDAGVMYEGRAGVSLTASSPSANTPAVQSALASERSQIEHDANYLEFFPVLTLAATYRF